MSEHQRMTVILDTNALWTQNEVEIFHSDSEALFVSPTPAFVDRILLPRVVLQELLFQRILKLSVLLGKASRDLRTTFKACQWKQKSLPTESEMRFALHRRALRWCKENRVQIVPPPVSEIDWKRLIHRAVNELPPFSPRSEKKEKGFKDALIYETVLHLRKKAPVTTEIALITDDDRLKEALERMALGSPCFLLSPSLSHS